MEEVADLAERLRLAVRMMTRRARAMNGPDGPSPTEVSVLSWLEEKGALTPSALSAAHQVRPQTMGQTLDGLESRGWVERGPHPRDRRQVLISLTPAGRRALAKGRRRRQAWIVSELEKLAPRELRHVASAITIFERFTQTKSTP
jgi:DNA-binding MarR family transcriptional regulator